MSTHTSIFDRVYRNVILTKFFTKGWGKPSHLKAIFSLRRQMDTREAAYQLVRDDYPIEVSKTQTLKRGKMGYRLLDGHFRTPAINVLESTKVDDLESVMPTACRTAHFQAVLPEKELPKAICLQFAGTGDHFFWRRRQFMALPLLEQRGIGSIIIENPFYGLRKPEHQYRSSLLNVTDIFVMGLSLMLESLVLYQWCKQQGINLFVFHGISMGGHMASLGATLIPEPVAVVPCLAWSSASLTFTKGVMAGAIPWKLLEQQLKEYREEIEALGGHWLSQDGVSAYNAGVEFAKIKTEQMSPEGLSDKDKTVVEEAKRRFSFEKVLKFNLSQKEKEELNQEALHFMRGIMDECTHLSNFPVPVDPSLCIAVAAENDAYQPRDGVRAIPEIWPGSQLRFIKGHGHVASYLIKHSVFRQAIYDALDELVRKHHPFEQIHLSG